MVWKGEITIYKCLEMYHACMHRRKGERRCIVHHRHSHAHSALSCAWHIQHESVHPVDVESMHPVDVEEIHKLTLPIPTSVLGKLIIKVIALTSRAIINKMQYKFMI